jgi:Eukaryotic DNA topoisomerase I, catalytic core
LSDPVQGAPTLEDRMQDLCAVMNATGSQCAAVLGLSEGGPVSVLFAATYPERVTALTLYGTFARMTRTDAYPWGYPSDVFERFVQVKTAGEVTILSMSSRLLAGTPKEKVLACTLYLLDAGFFRIGGEEYADENGSYGLVSLRKQHARVVGESVVSDYPAKSGRERIQAVVDRRIRQIVTTLNRRRGRGRLRGRREMGGPGLGRDQRSHPGNGQHRSYRQGLPDLERDRASRGRLGSLMARIRCSHIKETGGPARRERGVLVPGQYSGGVPAVLHRPPGDRSLHGRDHHTRVSGHVGRRPRRRLGDPRGSRAARHSPPGRVGPFRACILPSTAETRREIGSIGHRSP